jgi:hypothetical protein
MMCAAAHEGKHYIMSVGHIMREASIMSPKAIHHYKKGGAQLLPVDLPFKSRYCPPTLRSANSMAFFTMLPQSLDETSPQPPFLTVSYTPSSLAISALRLSDMML